MQLWFRLRSLRDIASQNPPHKLSLSMLRFSAQRHSFDSYSYGDLLSLQKKANVSLKVSKDDRKNSFSLIMSRIYRNGQVAKLCISLGA